MKELGKYLKKLRESKNLSLNDVAESTKIHIYKLMAIEEGNKSALPAKVFCVGLIKSYAKELQADMQKVDQLCIEAFQDEVEIATVEKPVAQHRTEEEPIESQPMGRFQIPKTVGIIISLIIILFLVTGIYFVVKKLNSYSEEENLPPTMYSENKPIVNEPETTEKKETEKKPTSKPKKNELKRKNKKPSKEQTKEENQKADQQKTQVVANPIEAKDKVESSEIKKAPVKVESDNKLIITALEPIRAEIIWSDGFVQVMLLKSNESKTLIFSTPIKVKFNNGGAVQVSFNDSTKKVPGTLNKPIELNYP